MLNAECGMKKEKEKIKQLYSPFRIPHSEFEKGVFYVFSHLSSTPLTKK